MLSPMSAPIDDGDAEEDPLQRARDGGRGDDHDRVARHEQADEHARLEHDRESREQRPHDRIDALHGVEQPRQELVHAPSLGPRPAP